MSGERVAHLIAPAPAGGAESVVLALATAARDRSQVIVLNQVAAADEPPLPLTLQLRARGVQVDELRCGRRQYRAEVRAVTDVLVRGGVSVLHAHGYHSTVVGYFASRRAKLPCVATVHGYLSRNLKERFYNVVDRFFLRRYDAVIAVSQGIDAQLLASGVQRERLVVVQNGLVAPADAPDRARARALLGGVTANEPVVGWVGRLSIEKGGDLFLRAWQAGKPPARAVIVGEGSEQERLEALSRELGVSSAVRFDGFRPDAAAFLPAFDILALSSRIEGTPMIVLESVAAGVPIVTFSVGGIPDLLDHRSAWLVPPENVDAFGAALRDALASPDERQRRAAAARAHLADRLSAEKWLERVWHVYERARARPQGR